MAVLKYGGRKMDKSVLYKLSYGLYAIGAQGGACIVNTVLDVYKRQALTIGHA